MNPNMTDNQVVVKLNVGGVRYETSLSNLVRYPESMLGRWFLEWNNSTEEKFIDFDGPTFGFILEFLRHGPLMVLPEDAKTMKQLRLAADYFMLDGLKEFLVSEVAGLVGSALAPGALLKFSRFGIASVYKSLMSYGAYPQDIQTNGSDFMLGSLFPIGDAWKAQCPGCNTTSLRNRAWSEAFASVGEVERDIFLNSMSHMKFSVVTDYGMCVYVKQMDLNITRKFHIAKAFVEHA